MVVPKRPRRVPNESSLWPWSKRRRHRRIEIDDAGIAHRARAQIARRRTLARDLDVGFDAAHPIAPLPVVAALDAADRTIEIVRRAGGEQRSAGGEVAEDRVGLGLAGAVADVGADIRAGPSPGGQNRRLEDRRTEAGRRLVVAALVDRRHAAELGVHEELDAAPRHQDFVLVELHGVAHIDVEQVVADEAGRDLGRAPRRISPVLLVADLHLEQVVAGRRRVVLAEVALPERVQQAHAHEPVVVAPIGAAAEPHWRHARERCCRR